MSDTWVCPVCDVEYFATVTQCIECGRDQADDDDDNGLPEEIVFTEIGPLAADLRADLDVRLFEAGIPNYWDDSESLVVPKVMEASCDRVCATARAGIDSGEATYVDELPSFSEMSRPGTTLEDEARSLASQYLGTFEEYETSLSDALRQRDAVSALVDEEIEQWRRAGEQLLNWTREALDEIREHFRKNGKGQLVKRLESLKQNLDAARDEDGLVYSAGEEGLHSEIDADQADGAGDDADLTDIVNQLEALRDKVQRAAYATSFGLPVFGKASLLEAAFSAAWDAEDLLDDFHGELRANYAPYRESLTTVVAEVQRRARAHLKARVAVLDTKLATLEAELDSETPAWDSAAWEGWLPRQRLPRGVRIGRLVLDRHGVSVRIPAVISLPGGRPLVISTSAGRDAAVRAAQALLLRLVALFPPGDLRFTFIDPVGLGQSVAPLLHLADHDEALVGGKVWTEASHIEARLGETTEHVELVIQKYLRGQYATIEEHNVEAGEIAEPYRVVAVFDFPQSFTEVSAHRLASIVANGPRCGVYPVIICDSSLGMPYGFDPEGLYRSAIVIGLGERGFVWDGDVVREFTLELDQPPDLGLATDSEAPNLFTRIIGQVGRGAKASTTVEVSEERLFALLAGQVREDLGDGLPAMSAPVDLKTDSTWWTGNAAHGVSSPLGRSGATSTLCLSFGNGTAQHALIVGKTGSGKSTLLHALIVNAALVYSPSEVEFYLVDFKKGVEFKPYASLSLPHARVIAIESEREFGLSVLRGLDSELDKRGDLFRSSEPPVDNIADYRRSQAEALPRILLIIDEFHELFAEEDRLAAEAAGLLDRLVRQGRAFGLHVVLGSQTLAGIRTIGRSTLDQIAIRIALQCSEADSRLVLADDNPAARLLGRPGEAIYNAANGTIAGNQRFQVVWLPDDERDDFLNRVRARALREGWSRVPLVFEGDATAALESNSMLESLLRTPQSRVPTTGLRLWVGEPLGIADPTSVSLRRRAGASLLVVGRDEDAQIGLVAAVTLSAAAQLHHRTDVRILDFTALDADASLALTRLASCLPGVVIGRRRQIEDVLKDVLALVGERTARGATSDDPVLLLLHGLGRARDFDPESTDYAETAPSAYEMLSQVLRDGPEVGVHTIATADSMNSLERRLDRRALREFSIRIALRMGADDSARLLDTPGAEKLKNSQALLVDEDDARSEKFRMYGPPDEDWLDIVSSVLVDDAAND